MHGVRPPSPRDDREKPVPAPGTPAATAGPGPATVAVAGSEFGWGSSGKLSAVLAALRERSPRPLRFVGLASGLGRPLLDHHAIDRWYDLPAGAPAKECADAVAKVVEAERIDAAVVVLDGPAAVALETAGVPTVFVDSLPFLWTEGDLPELPLEVSVYCAQQCVELPQECLGVLGSVRELRWVEAVIGAPPVSPAGPAEPRRSRPEPFRRALLNLGGLRAPDLADWTRYPEIVVPAVFEALATYGVREVHVAGNLPAALAARLCAASDADLDITAGPLSHGEFLHRLDTCDLLLTSPGLTTLLEAGSLSVPTVCLPPQNLSQIFNGRFHSRAVLADVRVVWPPAVFAEDEALARRSQGEEAALQVIYGGITAAAKEHNLSRSVAAVRDGVFQALRRASAGAEWGGLAARVGTGGAAQVAGILLDVLDGEPLAGSAGPRAPRTFQEGIDVHD
ncbi:hydroxymethylcytosylglucuronate/cytosylglucuronate synthase [Streptomyces sp. NPDC032198]|uniref:hydroxymethylcytosylglucuronate/cytosylglucurona te synthase n=1 Tax=Streptomyces sp. NPDC032198 TaxID=3155127 RepID=UPI0033DE46BB